MFEFVKFIMDIVKFIVEVVIKYGFRLGKKSYYIKEENINIECGNLVDDIVGVNTVINPTDIIHHYKIKEKDLICEYRYKGLIRKNGIAQCDFVFSSTNQVPYDEMECYAIDNKIQKRQRPRLIGTDGLVKKISIGFDEALRVGDNFDVFLHINLEGCVGANKDYIISRVSYAISNISKYEVEILFDKKAPETMDVYVMNFGTFKREKIIYPSNENELLFIDEINHNISVSLRVYVFNRDDGDLPRK